MNKECTTCHVSKPLEDYNKSSGGKHGRASRCRDCTKAWQAEYRRTNPGKQAEWWAKNREKRSEYTKRWNEKNPEKARATIQKLQEQYKKESSRTASNNGKAWTDEDYVTLMRDDISLMEISKLLGRTYASVGMKRSTYGERLRRLAMIEEVQKRMAG